MMCEMVVRCTCHDNTNFDGGDIERNSLRPTLGNLVTCQTSLLANPVDCTLISHRSLPSLRSLCLGFCNLAAEAVR